MTPAKFIATWSPVTLFERAASQQHFIDLASRLAGPLVPRTPPKTEGRKNH